MVDVLTEPDGEGCFICNFCGKPATHTKEYSDTKNYVYYGAIKYIPFCDKCDPPEEGDQCQSLT